MTVPVESPIVSYATDGVTGTYVLGFSYSEPGDVAATLTDALGNVTTPAFSVSGGNAICSSVPAAGGTIVFTRGTPISQLADFVSGDSFASGAVDAAFDRAVRIIQEQALAIESTVRAPYGEVFSPLPQASARALQYLAFDAAGRPALSPGSVIGGPTQMPSIPLFTGIASYAMPSAVTAFITGGYATAGLGGGMYVCDALATAGLAASCPRFCKQDGGGRYFRLAGPVVFVEQGGATGTVGANDQIAAQAALAYAAAVGIRKVSCQQEAYTLWAPLRTTTPNTTLAPDGHYLVPTADVEFSGCETGTTFTLLNSNGGPYSTVTQTVSGTAWYGGAIYPWPNGNNTGSINELRFTRITMTGGVGYTMSGTVPAGNTGPGQTGVNLFGKGFWAQGVAINNLYFTDCEFWGFYAEVMYLAMSNASANVTINGLKLHDSPQSAWNPSGYNIVAYNLQSYQTNGTEILGGQGHKYVACRFWNSNQFSATGGPANGLGFNYAYPTRVSTVAPPWIDFLDCDWTNITEVIIGTWTRGHKGCTATDAPFVAAQAQGAYVCGAFFDSYWDLAYTLDQANSNPIITLQGPANLTTLIPGASGTNYVLPPQNVHFRLDVHRTQQAKANGYFGIGYLMQGYVDQTTCSLAIGESDGLLIFGSMSSEFAVPLMTMDSPASTGNYHQGAYQVAMSAGPYALHIVSPRMSLQNTGGAATIAVTVTAPYSSPYGYANGQRARIWWDGGSTAGTVFAFAQNGTGLALKGNRRLYKFGDWLDLEFNTTTGLWHEFDYHAPGYFLNGSGSITPASLATGAMAALGTVTVNNAAVGDLIDSVSASSATGGVNLWGEVTAANTVTIYARNDKGSAYAPGATIYTVTGHKA